MEIIQYTIEDFKKLDFNKEFLKYDIVPITPTRIKSQINNPHALNSDIVLSVAVENQNTILGYIGALPYNVNGEHCAWNSCWWSKTGVSAEVSMQLFYTFISNWNKKVLFSEMTPHTSKIISAMNICEPCTTYGIRGYIRFNLAKILPSKDAKLKPLKPILFCTDAIANFFINLITTSTHKYQNNNIRIEEKTALDNLDNSFIQQHQMSQFSCRTKNDFDWIQKHPWIITKNDNLNINPKYYFTYKVKEFETRWAKFYEHNKLKALVYYTIKNNELKLQYVFCEKDIEAVVANFFYNKVVTNKKLHSITTFHKNISEFLSNRKKFIFKTRLPKLSAIAKDLKPNRNNDNLYLQMGDGDCIFT